LFGVTWVTRGEEAIVKERPCTKVSGPLAQYAAGFREELLSRGYALASVRNRLWQLNHVSRWLHDEGVALCEFTPERVEQFLAARREAGYATWLSPRSMSLPLGYLRDLGVVPTPGARGEESAVDLLIRDYRRYLLDERALASNTVGHYANCARLFLGARPGGGVVDVGQLVARDVTEFVIGECAGRSVSAAKYLVAGLRSLLRYLHVAGVITAPLAAAVPSVAHRRGTSLSRGLNAREVARLLAGCDRRRVVGRRDYAMLTLLVRLGLRSHEVAVLELDDVDWHRGEIVIRGKGDRHERLPLPHDVGEAIVAYLRRGRAQNPAASRKLFLRVKAPHGGLAPGGVRGVVHDACVRVGLPEIGAHRLRHTAATEMLRHGASLPEVAQVLRHHRLDTTAIYAKVDRTALGALAQPWPGATA
jgi:integrase/recombinase XerD